MPRSEALKRAQDRYADKKPVLSFRVPDRDLYQSVLAASTEEQKTTGQWLREAAAEKLERSRKE